MRGVLQSYRWRRRLAWLGSSVLLLAGLVVAAILLPKDHGVHYQLNPTGTAQPQGYTPPPKEIPVTPAARDGVNETLLAFIRTGVTRSDPAAAWPLATPEMRTGISRRDWNRGELPVLPFPAQIPTVPDWTVITSYPGDLTVDLMLHPRPGAHVGPIAFAVELKRRDGRWLIDSMVPEQAFGAAGPSSPTVSIGKGREPKARLGPLYILVPIAVLALIVLVPLLIAITHFWRTRRIERRYRRERRP